ncbi:L,D-transpeptidase family protein [Nannocystis radixulma]|uniref:L,D-transpeptidase family protein n=1 Tax=Nannocystis radixulma TaxID=2995305 RepID=A0ABT5BKP6_9BACT|nr:L,D-transpeptidase family protein [Nannocystis radixulma]MDC0674719.1 L,D-transpeptidase family protein [Nannocystis radixulma]
MPRLSSVLAVLTALVCTAPLLAASEARAGDFLARQRRYPRVKAALAQHQATLEDSFRAAGAAWPPRGLFIRSFKDEAITELWAAAEHRNEPHVLVRTFPVCRGSGELGPKRREGDYQVPEGFYRVSVFNPSSSYHLSLGVSYPNAADRFHSAGQPPGGAIMIHGNCVTIGCIPLQDGPIEELYVAAVLARDAGQTDIPIHIFPCRLDDPDCQARLAAEAASRPELAAFWDGLVAGYLAFLQTGAPPRVVAKKDGTYHLDPPRERRPLVAAGE